MLSRVKTCVSSAVTRVISTEVDSSVDSYLAESHASVSGVFGVHLTRERFYSRLKLLFDFTLRLLEETRYLHVLTHTPDAVYNYVDKDKIIRLLETDKLSKMCGAYVGNYVAYLIYYAFIGLHFGLVGLVTAFFCKIAYDNHDPFIRKIVLYESAFTNRTQEDVLVNSALRTVSTMTYLVFLTTSIAGIFRFYSSAHIVDICLLGLLWPHVYNYLLSYQMLFVEVPLNRMQKIGAFITRSKVMVESMMEVYRDQPKYFDYRVLKNAFDYGVEQASQALTRRVYEPQLWQFSHYAFMIMGLVIFVFVTSYIVYDIHRRITIVLDTYCNTTLEKVEKARQLIGPYKEFIKNKVSGGTILQAGKDEFYIKEWDIFNKNRFETNMRSKDEIAYGIKHNLVNVTYENQTAMGLILRTGKMLLPSHFIPKNDVVATAVRYDDSRIGNRKFMVSISTSVCTHVSNKDFVVLDFVDGGTFSDITNLLPKKFT